MLFQSLTQTQQQAQLELEPHIHLRRMRIYLIYLPLALPAHMPPYDCNRLLPCIHLHHFGPCLQGTVCPSTSNQPCLEHAPHSPGCKP